MARPKTATVLGRLRSTLAAIPCLKDGRAGVELSHEPIRGAAILDAARATRWPG